MSSVNRRDFIKAGAAAGMGISLAAMSSSCAVGSSSQINTAPMIGFKVPPIENVRIGFVGVGGMGGSHVRNLLKIKGCQITAICDILPARVEQVQKWVQDAGFPQADRLFPGRLGLQTSL